MPATDTTPDAVAAADLAATVLRRARPIYRVFVSSTWVDLQPDRRALMEALNRMEEMRFVGMEFFGNRPDDTHDASIDQVDRCEVFVGIIGFRYGSGITEAEYRRARQLGLPCFVYFKREENVRPELTDGDPALAAKLAAFKQDLMRSHTVKEVGSPEELAASATADLHNWVAAHWVTAERTAAAIARAPAADAGPDRTNILRLLERIHHDWIEGVLEASLHHRAWLELGLDWNDDAVEHPWDRIVVAPNRPIRTLTAKDSITGVFDAAQNTLLVLGEPGAGKTTTLLELARDLIARARQSTQAPAPVVLALSTWTGAPRDLFEWLVAELGSRYQVPKRLARAWIEDARLVLLLDGLDEVVPERRAACVEAINAFEQAHHPPGLAVTCRVAEYDALPAKLRLRAAICLQPLTPEQVGRYLAAAGPALEPLAAAMRDDPGLRELARTPLMLSVMTMAWRDAGHVDLRTSGAAPEERRRQLFDAYVHAVTHRRGKAAGPYSAEQTIGWLAWLANQMKRQGHSQIAIEQLQPGWLAGVWPQCTYFVASRMLGPLVMVVPWILFLPLIEQWAPDRAVQFSRLREATPSLVALSIALGLAFAAIDLVFARYLREKRDAASWRFIVTLIVSVLLISAWNLWVKDEMDKQSASWVIAMGGVYLVIAGFTFCGVKDVGMVDIRPTDTLRWSWKPAVDQFFVGLVAINLIICTGWVSFWCYRVAKMGSWQAAFLEAGDVFSYGGMLVGAMLAAVVWRRLRPRWSGALIPAGLAFVSLGGQLGYLCSAPTRTTALVFLLLGVGISTLIGSFGGFGTTMIDPSRSRRRGVWFWLRVPALALLIVWLLTAIPLLVLAFSLSINARPDEFALFLALYTTFAAFGLMAFFRFGGAEGMKHYILRWLLVRGGKLPSKPEVFLNHAAQLALMQKVGFGYRFVHALLLEHLAGKDVK